VTTRSDCGVSTTGPAVELAVVDNGPYVIVAVSDSGAVAADEIDPTMT